MKMKLVPCASAVAVAAIFVLSSFLVIVDRGSLEIPASTLRIVGQSPANSNLLMVDDEGTLEPYAQVTVGAHVESVFEDEENEFFEYSVDVCAIASKGREMEVFVNKWLDGVNSMPNLLATSPYSDDLYVYEDYGVWVSTVDNAGGNPHAFWYCGAWYEEFFIASNGFICFDRDYFPNAQYFNVPPLNNYQDNPAFPNANGPDAVIAPLSREFVGPIYVTHGWYNDCYMIIWNNPVDEGGTDYTGSFAVMLPMTHGEQTYLVYEDCYESAADLSMGFEDQTGRNGFDLEPFGIPPEESFGLGTHIFRSNLWPEIGGLYDLTIEATKIKYDNGNPVNDDEATIQLEGPDGGYVPGAAGVNVDLENTGNDAYDGSRSVWNALDAGIDEANSEGHHDVLGVLGCVADATNTLDELSPADVVEDEHYVPFADYPVQTARLRAYSDVEGSWMTNTKAYDSILVSTIKWRISTQWSNPEEAIHELQITARLGYGQVVVEHIETSVDLRADYADLEPLEWYGCTIPYDGYPPDNYYLKFWELEYLSLQGGHVDQIAHTDDYVYYMLGVSVDTYLVGSSGMLSVSGWFRMWDNFPENLWETRRYVNVYVLDEDGTTILAETTVLDHDDYVDTWIYVDDQICSGLDPYSTVRVGVGRIDAWVADNRLMAEWAGVEITAPANPDDPDLWSKYDEAAGMTASDSSGNGYTGDLEGVSFSSDGANGNCVYSSGGYANCVDYGNVLGITGDITISCWVKTDSERDFQWLVTKSPNTGYGRTYSLALHYDSQTDKYDVHFVRGNSDGSYYLLYMRFAEVFSPDGLWHFIAVRHDTSTGSYGIRVDDGAWGGDLLAGTGVGTAYDDDSPLQVGNMNSGLGGSYRSLDGYIDDVRIWDEYVADHVIDDAYIEVEPAIKVLYPNGFEHLERYTTDYIYWDTQGFEPGELVSIILYSWGSQEMVIVTGTANDGVHQWNCDPYANPIGEHYQIRIYSYSDPNIEDYSDSYFTIMYVPASPQNLVGYYVPTGYVHLSWDEPFHDGYHPDGILGYKVYKGIKQGPSIEWDSGTWTDDLYYDDSQVQPNKTYFYYVTAINDIGESTPAYNQIKVQCK